MEGKGFAWKVKTKLWGRVVGFVKKKLGKFGNGNRKGSDSSANLGKKKSGITQGKYSDQTDPKLNACTSDSTSNLISGGGATSILYMRQESPLSIAQAQQILNEAESNDLCSVTPPSKPQGGDVYLFYNSGDDCKNNDWRCDGIRWAHAGHKKLPSKSPVLRKMYFKVFQEGTNNGSEKFQKHAYVLIDKPQFHLIHYIGDECEFRPVPHGNGKTDSRPYTRTCPSVLTKIKRQVDTESSGNVYKKLITDATPGVFQGILNPRNLK